MLNRREGYQYKYKQYYDASHKTVTFKVGEKVRVLFDAPAKGFLVPMWEGSYTILAQVNPVTYRVQNESRLFPVHVQRLTKFYERIL